MELTLQLKLLPTEDQVTALRDTMARFNEACTWLAIQAFAQQCSNKLTLQRLYYHELRSRFALSSQMAVRCLARVQGRIGGTRRSVRPSDLIRPCPTINVLCALMAWTR